MNLARTTAQKLIITGAPALDPITVFTEDYEPGKGKLTITCFGRAWTAYWGGMSGRTVRQFVVSCNAGYVVNNLTRGMGARRNKEAVHEDAYLTRIVEAVQAAFRELNMTSKRRAQLERLGHANALIKVISEHGRRFFWCEKEQRLASLELDAKGKVWFINDYQGKRIYTHDTNGRWRGFSHGGALRALVIDMRDYVRVGKQIPRWKIAIKQLSSPMEDIWGYGFEAADATRQAAFKLPIMEAAPTISL